MRSVDGRNNVYLASNSWGGLYGDRIWFAHMVADHAQIGGRVCLGDGAEYLRCFFLGARLVGKRADKPWWRDRDGWWLARGELRTRKQHLEQVSSVGVSQRDRRDVD